MTHAKCRWVRILFTLNHLDQHSEGISSALCTLLQIDLSGTTKSQIITARVYFRVTLANQVPHALQLFLRPVIFGALNVYRWRKERAGRHDLARAQNLAIKETSATSHLAVDRGDFNHNIYEYPMARPRQRGAQDLKVRRLEVVDEKVSPG